MKHTEYTAPDIKVEPTVPATLPGTQYKVIFGVADAPFGEDWMLLDWDLPSMKFLWMRVNGEVDHVS